MKNRITTNFFLILMAIFILIAICSSQLFLFKKDFSLSDHKKDSLISFAAKALNTRDVPVGSFLIYNGEIIGSGYNTVLNDSNFGAHAEINALNNAVRKTGIKKFSELNRDSLYLLTTYEPCLMCRGALIENNIRHVVFMKSKGIIHWLKNDAKQFRYEWNKQQTTGSNLQDSLFMLHPDYPGRK